MTTTMGPPPSKNPAAAGEPSTTGAVETSTTELPNPKAMAPPPPRNPNQSKIESESAENHLEEPQSISPKIDTSDSSAQISDSKEESENSSSVDVTKKHEENKTNSAVPYTIPAWSGAPCHHFFLEVLKDGAIVNQYDVNKKGTYMFGRVDLCDFVLEHPTISRFHAVLQFKTNGDAYLYDLGSTHGTFINKSEVKKRVFVDLHVGDVIRFGHSSRLYIFQGPSDLMPREADLKSLRKAKIRLDTQDMEASLLRAKVEASRADGISWGMGEDAIEEIEDDVEEITWQTYKGMLTEKQEKTREKVIKRLEKIAHMKKEIDAIRAKDISQGGLTQGQQTQIARNEQRTSQIMEELVNLEETLNESIRESLGARTGRLSGSKKKGAIEDEEDYLSDDDDFYDRTQKTSKQKNGENQSVETADSLLDKKEAIIKRMQEKEKLLLDEEIFLPNSEAIEAGDELDAYMSSVSSQLVLDNKEKLRKELSSIQSELDRILYLLKIADPTGEASKKRESKGSEPIAVVNNTPTASSEKSRNSEPKSSLAISIQQTANPVATPEPVNNQKEPDLVNGENAPAATVYTVIKPQWLGAVTAEDKEKQEIAPEPVNIPEKDQFVDYKDRGAILTKPDSSNIGLEDAAPGLIIRKRKKTEISEGSLVKDTEDPVDSKLKAEDAVALLLKHSRGYHALEEEEIVPVSENVRVKKKGKKEAKRVLGPEKPSFLDDEPDHTAWVPPEGQSGDGRTSLNDRFGY